MYALSPHSNSALIPETWLEIASTSHRTCCISMTELCGHQLGVNQRRCG